MKTRCKRCGIIQEYIESRWMGAQNYADSEYCHVCKEWEIESLEKQADFEHDEKCEMLFAEVKQ